MSDQGDMKLLQAVTYEAPYCSDPECLYCRQLREMQEQVSRREADYRATAIRRDSPAITPSGFAACHG
jgi:hypothetical protein